jgi:molecular chaperone GrpE (heat shock protein)
MAGEDSSDDMNKMLSEMDFGKMMDAVGVVAEQKEKHRKETTDFLFSFLEVMDSLEALVIHCEELAAKGYEHVPLRSAKTILRQALGVLSQAGVEQMNATGQPLNLEQHEVEAVRPDSSAEEDTVLEEKVRGYLWKGAILRRAKVVIAH